MNAISFSLYGDVPKYIVGMARNIELSKQFYPGWQVHIYIDETALRALNLQMGGIEWLNDQHVRLINTDVNSYCPLMMQRFLIADNLKIERFIIRDADSRLSQREVDAVNVWINSGLLFHSMLDHWAHARGMNGGLVGGKWRVGNWIAQSMESLVKKWMTKYSKSYQGHDEDQGFLNRMIYPWAKYSMLTHSSIPWPGSVPFPSNCDRGFVGEVYEADGTPRPEPIERP